MTTEAPWADRDILDRLRTATFDSVTAEDLRDAVAEIERLRAERIATVRPLLPAEHIAYTVSKSQIGRGENPPRNTTAALLLAVERLSGITEADDA